MIQTQMEVKKIYSFLNPSINSWDLTDNEEIAKQDSTYAQASLEDLHDFVAGCGYIFKGLIETADGVVQWYEESKESEDGGMDEYSCGYKLFN